MTPSVLRIAALFLSASAAWAGAPPAGPDGLRHVDGFVGSELLLRTAGELPDWDEVIQEVDPNFPNAIAVGLFCGGIAKHTYDFSEFTFKNLDVTVDAGDNIRLEENGVLLKQIAAGEYSTFGQCLRMTIAAMQQFAK